VIENGKMVKLHQALSKGNNYSDICLNLHSVCAVDSAEEKATFGVVVGCSRILRAEDVVRAAVANPNIADIVVVSKTEVIVNGKAEEERLSIFGIRRAG